MRSFELREDLNEELRQRAFHSRISMSEFIRNAIKEKIKNE